MIVIMNKMDFICWNYGIYGTW